MFVPLLVKVKTYVTELYTTVMVLTKLPEYAIVAAKSPMGKVTPFDDKTVDDPDMT